MPAGARMLTEKPDMPSWLDTRQAANTHENGAASGVYMTSKEIDPTSSVR